MRRFFVVLSLPGAVASVGLAGGCSGSSAGGADASIDGSGVILPGGDATGGEGNGDGTTNITTTMRLAHASPELGPIDFCWRPTGTATFTGPVLASAVTPVDAGASPVDAAPAGKEAGAPADGGDADVSPSGAVDAGAGDEGDDVDDAGGDASGVVDAAEPEDAGPTVGLAFGAMTPDVTFPTSGTFDIAIVAAGQTSCLQPHLVDQVTLDAGKRSTAVVMGQPGVDAGTSALTIAAFLDAPDEPLGTRVRFIHAALGTKGEPATPALSIAAGATPLATDVPPGDVADPSMSPAVDSLGYTTLDPVDGTASLDLATVGDAAPAHWTTTATALGLDLGSTHTGIIVSLGQGALGVAWCADVADAGGRTACTLITALP